MGWRKYWMLAVVLEVRVVMFITANDTRRLNRIIILSNIIIRYIMHHS